LTDKVELARRLQEASSKVLILNDMHLRDKPPRNCTDLYLDDIFDILKFTTKLEKALDLDAVIWAGDVFDHKMPSRNSHRLVLQAIEVVKAYRRLLILPGNHDISNDRLESIEEQQPLGVLYEAGAERLEGWVSDLPIFGIPWQQRWNEPGTLEEVFTPWVAEFAGDRELFKSLVVTHASIFPPGSEPGVYEYVPTQDIAAAMNHVGYLEHGHIHDYHGIYEVDGVQFCNLGAVSRGSLTESNQERPIQAALWTTEHGFLAIDLPHRPSEEIFYLDQAHQARQEKISDERFLEEVGSTRLEISSIASVVSHIQGLDEEKVAPPVKKKAIELLELQDV
jgi:DNA repair exonuclease SbcCD nuclease subunit